MELGDASYEVLVGTGVLGSLRDLVAATGTAAGYAVISDSTVAPLYAEKVRDVLTGIAPSTVLTFPAGEWNKTRETWADLTDQMLRTNFDRDAVVVAVGGGVVGDVAGFVAATYLRGVPVIQIPTSLLAMIDSSIGGKTGVDVPSGKNLVGAFHQPLIVIADTDTLATLPKPHLSAGLAEALKHGVIADAAYFDWILGHADDLFERDDASLTECVHRSVAIKAAIVAEDERERGKRSVLNFGHTVAHALEAALGYALLHGEAVALGMIAEARLGASMGLTDPALPDRIEQACVQLHLPIEPPTLEDPNGLYEIMLADKKARSGTVRFALPETTGTMAQADDTSWTFEADKATIDAVLTSWV